MEDEGVLVKTVLVSSFYPETNYSRSLAQSLERVSPKDWELVCLGERDGSPAGLGFDFRPVFLKNVAGLIPLALAIWREKPQVVHLQHEINMFGRFNAPLFPLLVLLLRLVGKAPIVTIHAVPSPQMVDLRFMETFGMGRKRWMAPFLKLLFAWIYRATCLSARTIIVHADLLRQRLATEYGAKPAKILVCPIGVHEATTGAPPTPSAPWAPRLVSRRFVLCFGYLIRRKRLELVIDAFKEATAQDPELLLVLAGGTLDYAKEYLLELQKKVRDDGLAERVVFINFISHAEITWLFSQAEAVVHNDFYSISASGPLSWALRDGKPMLVADVGVMAEELRKNRLGGIGVHFEDQAQAVRGFRDVLYNRELRDKLLRSNRLLAATRDWNAIARWTWALYSAHMAGGNPRAGGDFTAQREC
jgi:glycosyltransferase involved in cell wall biosynthesis